jgi:hypothetical protein
MCTTTKLPSASGTETPFSTVTGLLSFSHCAQTWSGMVTSNAGWGGFWAHDHGLSSALPSRDVTAFRVRASLLL